MLLLFVSFSLCSAICLGHALVLGIQLFHQAGKANKMILHITFILLEFLRVSLALYVAWRHHCAGSGASSDKANNQGQMSTNKISEFGHHNNTFNT